MISFEHFSISAEYSSNSITTQQFLDRVMKEGSGSIKYSVLHHSSLMESPLRHTTLTTESLNEINLKQQQ